MIDQYWITKKSMEQRSKINTPERKRSVNRANRSEDGALMERSRAKKER